MFRSRWADNIYASRSFDDGRTWTEPEPTELPNNNSSLQMTRLMNGDLGLPRFDGQGWWLGQATCLRASWSVVVSNSSGVM